LYLGGLAIGALVILRDDLLPGERRETRLWIPGDLDLSRRDLDLGRPEDLLDCGAKHLLAALGHGRRVGDELVALLLSQGDVVRQSLVEVDRTLDLLDAL